MTVWYEKNSPYSVSFEMPSLIALLSKKYKYMGILPSPQDNRNKNICLFYHHHTIIKNKNTCVFYHHHTIIEIKIYVYLYVYFTIATRLKGMNNVGPFLT